MKIHCPNSQCQKDSKIIKDGKFKRSSDSRAVQRFRCKGCGLRFSRATFSLAYYQKKRRINYPLAKLLCSGVSQRRAALILGVSRHAVARRIPFFGQKYRKLNEKFLKSLKDSPVKEMQFDDLITKENSKLKPLTVTTAVDERQRFILGAKVAQIPSFGHLAKIARRRYGKRECYHRWGLDQLLMSLGSSVCPSAVIKSDEHKKYSEFVRKYFPKAKYLQYPSERACVAGQGELKKIKFDPLFAINHTCAMLRANINRLIRKTWCTTKDPKRLQDHIDLFIWFYNQKLLSKTASLTPI